MPVKYDPNRGFLRTALSLSNTAIPSVLARFEFWLLFYLHLAIGAAYRLGYIEDSKGTPFTISWEDMGVISAITTFFQVFYTNACFSRYMNFYNKIKLMLGTLLDYCFELRLHVSPQCPQHARLASRQIVASVLLFFYEMDNVSELEWEELERQGFVKPRETTVLKSLTSQQHSLITLHWSAEAAQEGCKRCKANANVMKGLVGRILMCRGLQQEVIDDISMPVPYQYFHLLKMMLLVNLVCWAYGMAMTRSIFAPLVYWVCLLIFMGVMELASQLADPFGDDEVDFPVAEWLDEFVESVAVLMEFRTPESFIKDTVGAEQPLEWKHPGLKVSLAPEGEDEETSCYSGDSREEATVPLMCS
mmetsp:Transcript_42629/g.132632  ORF Transcript_42629/g.132632 Transcript_42629/m.132632 type:complete len:361 (+) Transcript_42629:96-1178(+)